MSAPMADDRKIAMLILRDEGADLNDARGKEMFARFVAWVEELSARGVIHDVEGLARAGRTVRRKGATLVVDGPYAEGREAVLGFIAVRVADLDEACRIAGESPYAPFGAIEVRLAGTFPKPAKEK